MLRAHLRRATPTRFDLDQTSADLNSRFGWVYGTRSVDTGRTELRHRHVLNGESIACVTSKLMPEGYSCCGLQVCAKAHIAGTGVDPISRTPDCSKKSIPRCPNRVPHVAVLDAISRVVGRTRADWAQPNEMAQECGLPTGSVPPELPLGTSERQELVELRRKVHQLQMERTIVAKAGPSLQAALFCFRLTKINKPSRHADTMQH